MWNAYDDSAAALFQSRKLVLRIAVLIKLKLKPEWFVKKTHKVSSIIFMHNAFTIKETPSIAPPPAWQLMILGSFTLIVYVYNMDFRTERYHASRSICDGFNRGRQETRIYHR